MFLWTPGFGAAWVFEGRGRSDGASALCTRRSAEALCLWIPEPGALEAGGWSAKARRNLEVLWLINRVAPSFKTIADFRKDHAKAIVGVCQAFVAFCRHKRCLAASFWRSTARRSARLPAAAGDHAQERGQGERGVGAQDRRASGSNGRSRPRGRHARGCCGRGERLWRPLRSAARRSNASPTSWPATASASWLSANAMPSLMRTPNHGHQVAYNAQIAVDGEHKLIAAFELTNEGNDQRLLHPMAEQAKEAL